MKELESAQTKRKGGRMMNEFDLAPQDERDLVDFFSLLLEWKQEEDEAIEKLVRVLTLRVLQLKKL